MKTNYEFIGIDEGKQNLLRADTSRGVTWVQSLSDYPTARALQRLDKERVLMGYDRGYCIFSLSDGTVLHDCRRWKNVTSVHRCPDGRTLITGLNLEGSDGVCALTLDTRDNVICLECCPGDYVRLMTVMDDNHYLLSTNDHICLSNEKLKTLKILKAEGFLHAWKSLVLDDGSILVSGGYGAFMARFSSDGELLSTFGVAGEVPEEVNPFFYASFDLACDGSVFLANWQGHGPDQGLKGRQLLRFSQEGVYLESWSFPEVSSLQGLLMISFLS